MNEVEYQRRMKRAGDTMFLALDPIVRDIGEHDQPAIEGSLLCLADCIGSLLCGLRHLDPKDGEALLWIYGRIRHSRDSHTLQEGGLSGLGIDFSDN